MVLVDEQDLLDGALLEAHLVELRQQPQELGRLRTGQRFIRQSVTREKVLLVNAASFEWPTPPAGRSSPCSRSSGTSPGLPPPGPRRSPAHTDDLGPAGI